MCLGIPVKIVEKKGNTGIGEIGGVKREVDLRFLENVEIGDFVILHAAFAIQKLDEKEAEETLSLLNALFEIESGTD
ncbi:MAG: HypC/HybG/HupF family hydrogenase formation chaperone [Candidatus Cloacimonadota bacterium]|nr:MAG: HypC/HybG/HupF family hydrogenase formation chaperone [Candidatus Cloacimonadota bacterium]